MPSPLSSTAVPAVVKSTPEPGVSSREPASVQSKDFHSEQPTLRAIQIQPSRAGGSDAAVPDAQRDFGEALLLKMSGSNADYDKSITSGHAAFKGHNDSAYDLNGRKLTFSEWNILSEQHSIKRLRLSRTNLTDERFTHLNKLQELKELDLSKTQLTEKGISVLKSFPALETLSLEGIYLSDSSAQALSTLSNLKDLDISDTSISDKGMRCLTKLTKLERLAVKRLNLSDSACGAIAQMTQLKKLDLYRSDLNNKVALFLPLTHLIDLRLHESSINDAALDTVAHFQSVQELDLNGNQAIHDEGVRKLRGLKHLRWIGLGGTGITSKTLDVIANYSTLEDLGARNTLVDDSNLGALTALKNLKYIHLQGSRVTAKGRRELQIRMPQLDIIY